MRLPIKKLRTKNYTIGQSVCLSYVTEDDVVVNKLATVMVITNETLVVSCVGEEFVFYKTTKSVCGKYVLFASKEELKGFVENSYKFDEVKNELVNEIGELADGLEITDLKALIESVKILKKVKSPFKTENFKPMSEYELEEELEEDEEELEDEIPAVEELDKEDVLKNISEMAKVVGLVAPVPEIAFKDVLKEIKLEEMADLIKGNPMNVHAKERMDELAEILSQLPFKGAKVIKFPKE